jgi:acyl-CoA synthetase (NDP forming)
VQVTDDPAGARAVIAETTGFLAQLPGYRAMLDREGAANPEDVAVVGDEAAVRAAAAELLAAATPEDGDVAVLVAPQVRGTRELIAGVSRDPQFGPVVLFGLGGIFAEVFQDVSLRRAPLARRDAEQMVRELRGYPLLAGARGRPELDEPAVVEALLRLSDLAVALGPRLDQFDVNPLIVLERGRGVKAVDALVVGAAEGQPSVAAASGGE